MKNFFQKTKEMIENFKQDIHEMDNSDQLKNMLPHTTVYDMLHCISCGKGDDSKLVTLFHNTLKKQPEIVSYSALKYATYIEANAQNKVLLHGILFKNLFDLYMKHTNQGFDNLLLSESQLQQQKDRNIIDFIEYDNLPKRFRGIFVKYDANHYVLNVPHSQMIISCNKKNKKALEELLLRAKMLIPAIYKTVGPDMVLGGLQIFETNPEKPDFVEDSPAAKRVSDEQLKTIHELHDIFVKISKITLPIATNQNANSGALKIFEEFNKENHQQGIFVRAQDEAKNLKANQENIIKTAYSKLEARKEQLKENYKNFRYGLITMLANETRVRTK